MSKNKSVPKLRFGEFAGSGEWGEKLCIAKDLTNS